MPGRDYIFEGITTQIRDDPTDNETYFADADYENLIRLTHSGIPEHHLRIKEGAVMMIIANISVENGLCNGTRVQILQIGQNILRCLILTGSSAGQEFDLFRMRFKFGGDPKAVHEGAIRCERIQFPLRPGSAITIHKSQGAAMKFYIVMFY